MRVDRPPRAHDRGIPAMADLECPRLKSELARELGPRVASWGGSPRSAVSVSTSDRDGASSMRSSTPGRARVSPGNASTFDASDTNLTVMPPSFDE
jgi:hypothetical protein